jgi:hypothetical protein
MHRKKTVRARYVEFFRRQLKSVKERGQGLGTRCVVALEVIPNGSKESPGESITHVGF